MRHLVNRSAESPDIAAGSRLRALGTLEDGRSGQVFASLCEGGVAEVAEDEGGEGVGAGAGGVEEDVGGFHVAVDYVLPVVGGPRTAWDVAVVEIGERFGHLEEDVPDERLWCQALWVNVGG